MRNEHYASDEAYVYALADALREEYLQVVEAGLLLQVDDAFIPYNYDRMMLQGVSMEDYRKHCEMRIEAANYALRGIPETDPLPHLLGLLGRTSHQRRAAAGHRRPGAAHQRAGVFGGGRQSAPRIRMEGLARRESTGGKNPDSWRDQPIRRTWSTPGDRRRADQRYASVVGRENIMAGSDCGFAPGLDMAPPRTDVQWAKLAALADGARLGLKRLWGARAWLGL